MSFRQARTFVLVSHVCLGLFLGAIAKGQEPQKSDPFIPDEKAFAIKEKLRFKRPGSVHDLCLSPDGKLVAESQASGKIFLWEVSTGDAKLTIDGDKQTAAFRLAFSADGRRLAGAVSGKKKVVFWDVETGKEILAVDTERPPGSMAFDPKGKQLAIAVASPGIKPADPAVIHLRDAKTGALRRELPTKADYVTHLAFSPDGKWLANTNERYSDAAFENEISIWDADSGKEMLKLKGHKQRVSNLSFSPCGKWLASASWDRTARIWDAQTGELIHTITIGGLGSKIVFSPDGQWLLVSGGNASIRDVATGYEVFAVSQIPGSSGFVLNPQGTILVTSFIRDTVVWEVKLPKEKKLRPPQKNPPRDRLTAKEKFRFNGKSFYAVKISPDGQLLATSDRKGIVVRELATGKEKMTVPHDKNAFDLDFSPDGKFLVGGLNSKTKPCTLWEVATGREVLTTEVETYGGRLVFHPKGKLFAVAFQVGGSIELRDAEKGALIRAFKAHEGSTNDLAFSQDGKLLAISSHVFDKKAPSYPDNVVRLWDVESGKVLKTLKGHTMEPSGISFSPNGKWLASTSWDSMIKIWDVESGESVRTIWIQHMTSRVVWGPEAKWLAHNMSPSYGKVFFRDAVTRDEILVLKTDADRGLAINATGTILATASFDTVVVWELATEKAPPQAEVPAKPK